MMSAVSLIAASSTASLFASNAGRLAVLALPTALGVALAGIGVVRDARAAVTSLNAFTLYVGFPAIVVTSVLRVDAAVARSWAFWLVIPVVDAIAVAGCALWSRRDPRRLAGTMALVCLFGNTAYLGIPFVVSVLGESSRGPVALLVVVQVTMAVAFGPELLRRWSGATAPEAAGVGATLRRMGTQPLLWSPVVGWAARLLPEGPAGAVDDALSPLAAATAPLAMFLLGLYLYEHRTALRVGSPGVGAHVAVRLVAMPAISLGVAVAFERWAALPSSVVGVVVIMGAMPAAIATFSIAEQAEVATARVADIVVRTSLCSLVTLPIVATLVRS